jgi:hypothetical protein
VDISEGSSVPVEFSYSVKWKETAIPFERRMEKCGPSVACTLVIRVP